jgi:HK97 gp10 family phage protein
MATTKFTVTGLKEALEAFKELQYDIGDKDSKSKVMIPAVRKAMQPVLSMAQQLSPVDTGGLKLSLQVEGRRPTNKDRRSKYINPTDAVIAAVTTASGNKLKLMSEGKGLIRARKRLEKMGVANAKSFMGIQSDARAMVQEFGSSKTPAHSYLRPALENQQEQVVNIFRDVLVEKINQYRIKNK